MKKIYAFVLAIATSYTLVGLSACNDVTCKQGSGKMITETRSVKNFSKLDISGSYTVVIKQDSTESLSITADDNLMQYINTDVDGDKLRIKSKSNICSVGKLTLNIGLKNLSALKTAGAVTLSSANKITTKDLDINASGATNITLDLSADNVNTTGEGFSEFKFTGQASSHTVKLSGAGDLNALDFVVAKYTIETSGAGHCKINVLNSLDLNSSGASDVEYRGNPATINNHKAGASSLKKIDSAI